MAHQLQPCLTIGFVLSYAQQVLVERLDILSSFKTPCPLQLPSVATLTLSMSAFCPRPRPRALITCGSTPRSGLGGISCLFSAQIAGAFALGKLPRQGWIDCLHVCTAITSWCSVSQRKSTIGLGCSVLGKMDGNRPSLGKGNNFPP